MAFGTLWKTLSPKWLGIWIQAFSLIAIFFEGYDQGIGPRKQLLLSDIDSIQVLWEESTHRRIMLLRLA